MRQPIFALLSLATLAAVGCTPPARQSSTRPQERPSQSRPESRARERGDRQEDDRRGDTRYKQRSGELAKGYSNKTARAPRARPRTGTPGDFDFYLLTLSWSPEFCATHRQAAECAAHPGFILHGLWPQNTDASYPENCSNAPGPSNPSQYSDIFPDAGLLQHEWTTHGTCSGLASDAYFQLARRAFQSIHTPADLNSLTQQTSEAPAAILSDFASINPGVPQSSLALSCGNNYLTAVQVCLDKNLNAFACQVRSCAANIVRIVPRGGPASN